MTLSRYRKLLKTFSYDLSGTKISTIICQIIAYLLVFFSVLFWDSTKTLYIYYIIVSFLVVLSIIIDNTGGKGEDGILRYLSYAPVNSKGLVWYSYINRIWCTPVSVADFYIPAVIFLLAGVNIELLLTMIIRVHVTVIAFIYLRFLCVYLSQKKAFWFFLRLGGIIVFTMLPFLSNIQIGSLMIYDASIAGVVLVSLLTSNRLIKKMFVSSKPRYSKLWLRTVDGISGFIFPRQKTINRSLFKKTLRSKKVIDHSLYVLFFLLLALTLSNIIIDRTGPEMMKTLSFFVSFAMFTRIILRGTFIDALQLKYLPIGENKSKAITDMYTFMLAVTIWILMVLLLSVTFTFNVNVLVKGFILFMAYMPIGFLFKIKFAEKWHSEEEKKTIRSKTTKTSFVYFLVLLPFSIFMEWLINYSMTLSVITAVAVCIYYYYITYSKKNRIPSKNVTGDVVSSN